MKFSTSLLGLAVLTHGISAVAVPDINVATLDSRTPQPKHDVIPKHSTTEELWKRKGGGGGGSRGGGGGGGSSSGGKGGSSSSSSGGKGGSSSSSGKGGPLGSSSSNTGGRTTTGSGPPPRYGGYYPGGATVPYRAGGSIGSIVPALLVGGAIGVIAFSGLHYPYGAWTYPYNNPYTYFNATTNHNETKPVVCVCGAYDTCGCDDNGNQTYFNSVIGNGSYEGLNHTLVNIAENQTTHQLTIYINGALPNGTTAAGGSESPNAAANMRAVAQTVGWWPAAAVAISLALSL